MKYNSNLHIFIRTANRVLLKNKLHILHLNSNLHEIKSKPTYLSRTAITVIYIK